MILVRVGDRIRGPRLKYGFRRQPGAATRIGSRHRGVLQGNGWVKTIEPLRATPGGSPNEPLMIRCRRAAYECGEAPKIPRSSEKDAHSRHRSFIGYLVGDAVATIEVPGHQGG